MFKLLIRGGLLAGTALALAAPAGAAITVHTTQASWLAAVTGAQTDTFNNLAETLYNSPLNRNAGSVNYQVTAANGLYPGSVSGNRFMSTNTATNSMTLGNFSTSVSALAGRFFSSNLSGLFTASPQITVSVTGSAGSSSQVILNPTTSSFLGFTASTGTFSSMTVTGFNPSGATTFYWPSVDDFQVASAVQAPIPEPASWAMLIAGFGLTGATLRRRRAAAVAA